jgi:hypothetical protein
MTQFLIVYDQRAGVVEELREFTDGDRDVALAERFALERLHLPDEHIEVVVLSAASRADLERTHARYFKSVAEIASEHQDGPT